MSRLLVCGAVNWDTTLFVNKLPRPGEEVKVDRILSVPGGKGANTAVAAARVLGKKEVGVMGMLGKDEIAERQLAILDEEGVDTSCLSRNKEVLSGQAYVVVDSNGENMILTHRAANKAMTLDFIRGENIAGAIAGASMIILIDPPLEIARELAGQAKTRGKTLIFSPATLVNHGFSELDDLLNKSDYLILNEHETVSLAGEDTAPLACERLSAKLSGRRVVTTLGRTGCITFHQGKSTEIPAIDLSLFGLEPASTVGAGDTFVGTFASFKLMGCSDLEAVFLANVAAGLKITKEHTRGSPGYEEILEYANSDSLRAVHERFRST